MRTCNQVLVFSASGGDTYTAALVEGGWNVVEVPDRYGISPVTVSTVNSYPCDNLIFVKDEKVILVQGKEVTIKVSKVVLMKNGQDMHIIRDVISISPFGIKTVENEKFLFTPPTEVSDWIVTKTSGGSKVSLVGVNDSQGGIDLYLLGNTAVLHDKKGEMVPVSAIERII